MEIHQLLIAPYTTDRMESDVRAYDQVSTHEKALDAAAGAEGNRRLLRDRHGDSDVNGGLLASGSAES